MSESKVGAKNVITDISFDNARGFVFSGVVRGKMNDVDALSPFAVSLNYQNRSFPVQAVWSSADTSETTGPSKSFEFSVPLPVEIDEPLCSIDCDLPEWLNLSPEAETFLAEIFPKDDKAYEALFLRKVQRFGDGTLQYFVARQLSSYFSGLRAYRVGSAVVMAYKSIEAEDTDLQEEALEHVKMQLSCLGECEITDRPRTNREHLQVSLQCAQWHLELSLGRVNEFLATLERSRASASEIGNYFTPAFNLSMTLLMYCALLARRGDLDEAKEVALEGVQIFKSAVEAASLHLTLFEELRISHRNVHMMLCATKPDKRTEANYKRWFRSSIRVMGDPADRLRDLALSIYPASKAV